MKKALTFVLLITSINIYSQCKKWTYSYDAVGNRITRTYAFSACRIKNPPSIDSIISQANKDTIINKLPEKSDLVKESLIPQLHAVYPNPTQRFVNIQFNEFISNAQITIHDNKGNILFTDYLDGQLFTIDMSKEAAGTYILYVKLSNGKNFSKKIIKL